jgi:adenylate kinase
VDEEPDDARDVRGSKLASLPFVVRGSSFVVHERRTSAKAPERRTSNVMALNLIVLGPPGAGKGTQAERFAQARGIPRISTGDILRDAVTKGSELGRRAKSIMDRGELVSDDVMIGIVRERLDRADARRGFVLDGFPRTAAQAEALDAVMRGRDPLIVVDIEVPEAELLRRLASRLVCERCGTNAAPAPGSSSCARCGGRLVQRADDIEAVVRERLAVYERQSRPLVEYYRTRPTFRTIDGVQPPDRVAEDLAAAIEAVGGGATLGASAHSERAHGGRA